MIINLPNRKTGTDANVPMRGVERAAPLVREGFRIVEGRMFDSGKNEIIVGAGAAPGGLVWTVDTNTNDGEPRLQFLDTATMISSPYAWSGPYSGAATTNGGAYSSARSQAVLVDTSNDVLRAYAAGEHGDGTAFAAGVSA